MLTEGRLLECFDLKGRVIVVTGAAGLLGRQHVEAICKAGGTPILLDLSIESIEDLASHLRQQFNTEASAYAVDITQESQISKNVQEILSRYGKVDGLVNNAANNPKVESAGTCNFSRLENFPLDSWIADLNVGLTGAFLCAKHFGNVISKNIKGGVIVNISSDLGLIAPDQRLYRVPNLTDDMQPVKPVTYSVVKAGLIGLTRYLATYWTNVRCNALCPGGVEAGQDPQFVERVVSRIPMGRMARPNEYQAALVFLLSNASSYMNGAIVPIEGGRSVW